MIRRIAVALAIVGASCAAAQVKDFADFDGLQGFERQTLTTSGGDRLDIVRFRQEERLPALVIIPGSLCAPLFASLDSLPGEAFATVPLFSAEERDSIPAHLVYLERRNIVSLESLSSALEFSIEQIARLSPCTERNGGETLEHRVADVLTQVEWLEQQSWVESIHLIGISEGADVAAAVAAVGQEPVDSLLLIGGVGPSQFADFVAFSRQSKSTGAVSQAFSDLDKFLSSTAPPTYKGYSAKRWHSFAIANSALDNLLKSDIPVLIAHGEDDESVPIASADFATVELMRRQPYRAVFFWSIVGGDHMLATKNGSRLAEVVVHYARWATANPSGRTFVSD